MAANQDLARDGLPAQVEKLFVAAHVARARLAHKKMLAPNSSEGQAFDALDLAIREFLAWVELAGVDRRTAEAHTFAALHEKIATEKAAMLG